MKKNKITIFLACLSVMLGAAMTSCDDTQSYSDLLRDEEKAVNWYLSALRVEPYAPKTIDEFIIGEDAPYYKMDEDGYLYMQIVNKGSDEMAEVNDRVYFRFMRKCIKYLYQGYDVSWEGNAWDMNNGLGSTSLIYQNYSVPTTSQFGTGIQLPLQYCGYDSEVNLVISSNQGFTTDQTSCLPYIYNVKYYKAEY